MFRALITLFILGVTLSARTVFLMPEEAFIPSAKQISGDTVEIRVDLGKDIYVYEEQLSISDADPADPVVIASVNRPQAVSHYEDMVYLEAPVLTVKLAKTAAFEGSRDVTLNLALQGCSEQGLCYEPVAKSFTFSIDNADLPMQQNGVESVTVAEKTAEEPKAEAPAAMESETSMIARIIQEGNIGVIIATFFGFGLLLALTPCMFPMVPILSSVIVAQGEGLTAGRAFFLSVVYVLAMSVAYTIAGILAGLFGANLQAALQAPWMIILFSGLFVVLAMSMFDLFEFQMPNFIQSRLSAVGSHQKGIVGVALMGFLSALIVGPCVAAPLAGALIYISQSGDAMLGGMALFALSIGMGVPLLMVGTAAGRYMPKPGAWMDAIKHVFGFLMLGVSVWMLSRIIPEAATMLLWSALLTYAAVGLGAFEPIRGRCIRCYRAFKKGSGILLFMFAAALFVGGLTGATNPFDPLEKLSGGAVAAPSQSLVFKKVRSTEELDAILAASKGKKVLLDYYADWCVSCKEMEHNTFKDPAVRAKMGEFVLLQADLTANDDASKALSKRYNIQGPPTVIFFDEAGNLVKGGEIVGYTPPADFLKLLERY